ncbi:MAG TPA: TylF/MycF/NovP-related O-methyltransferase [Chitinophagaceae bacterium]
MKLSRIINYPLGLLGLKIVRLSRLKKLREASIISDIAKDQEFHELYEKINKYTIVGIERSYALYRAVKYILERNIKGSFVECGVWRGGSAMLIAYTLLKAGVTDKKIILYDTFEGMVKPGENDGKFEKQEWERMKIDEGRNSWCLSTIEEVQANMLQTCYPKGNIMLIKGKVEETIPEQTPGQIALLRLDTDWYTSTKHELTHLYPLLEKNGVLIIDDYGAWQGARKATDEYFAVHGPVYLSRIDFTGRLVIK